MIYSEIIKALTKYINSKNIADLPLLTEEDKEKFEKKLKSENINIYTEVGLKMHKSGFLLFHPDKINDAVKKEIGVFFFKIFRNEYEKSQPVNQNTSNFGSSATSAASGGGFRQEEYYQHEGSDSDFEDDDQEYYENNPEENLYPTTENIQEILERLGFPFESTDEDIIDLRNYLDDSMNDEQFNDALYWLKKIGFDFNLLKSENEKKTAISILKTISDATDENLFYISTTLSALSELKFTLRDYNPNSIEGFKLGVEIEYLDLKELNDNEKKLTFLKELTENKHQKKLSEALIELREKGYSYIKFVDIENLPAEIKEALLRRSKEGLFYLINQEILNEVVKSNNPLKDTLDLLNQLKHLASEGINFNENRWYFDKVLSHFAHSEKRDLLSQFITHIHTHLGYQNLNENTEFVPFLEKFIEKTMANPENVGPVLNALSKFQEDKLFYFNPKNPKHAELLDKAINHINTTDLADAFEQFSERNKNTSMQQEMIIDNLLKITESPAPLETVAELNASTHSQSCIGSASFFQPQTKAETNKLKQDENKDGKDYEKEEENDNYSSGRNSTN